MIKLDEMTNDEIWEQVEDCFLTIFMDVEHRCYAKHSTNGARYIQHLVRKNLIWIDRALLEIEIRERSAELEHDGKRDTWRRYMDGFLNRRRTR